MKDLAGGTEARQKKAIHKTLEIMSLAGWYWAARLHFSEIAEEQPEIAFPRKTHELDTEQSDAIAGPGGICGGEPVRGRCVGESRGSGADGGVDRARCAGRTHRADEEAGHANGSADRHPGRPHDRERVLHLLCGGGNGVAVAAGVFLCARGGHRFFARVGHARGAFGMECGCDAADVVGTRPGGFALEPRIVCGYEVPVLLLLGIGVGVDAGASGADWRVV